MTKSYLTDLNRIWYESINTRKRGWKLGLDKKRDVGYSNEIRLKKMLTLPAIFRVDPIVSSLPSSRVNKSKESARLKFFKKEKPYVVSSILSPSNSAASKISSPQFENQNHNTKIMDLSYFQNSTLSSVTTHGNNTEFQSNLPFVIPNNAKVASPTKLVLPPSTLIQFIHGAAVTNDLRLLMNIHKYINSHGRAIPWSTELYAALMSSYAKFYSHSAVKELAEKMKKDGITMGFSHLKAILYAFQNENNPHSIRRGKKIGEILKETACDDETYRLLSRNALKYQDLQSLKVHVHVPLDNHFSFREDYFKETFKELGINMTWIDSSLPFSTLEKSTNLMDQILNFKEEPKMSSPENMRESKLSAMDSSALIIDNPLDQRSLTPGSWTHLIEAYSQTGYLKKAKDIFATYIIHRKNLQTAMIFLHHLEQKNYLKIMKNPTSVDPKIILNPIPKRTFGVLFRGFGTNLLNPKHFLRHIVLNNAHLDDFYRPLFTVFAQDRKHKLEKIQEQFDQLSVYGEKRKENIMNTLSQRKMKVDSLWLPGDSIDSSLGVDLEPYTIHLWKFVGKEGPLKVLYEEYMRGWELAVNYVCSLKKLEPSDHGDQKKSDLDKKFTVNDQFRLFDPMLELPLYTQNMLKQKLSSFTKIPDESILLMEREDILKELYTIETEILNTYMISKGLKTKWSEK